MSSSAINNQVTTNGLPKKSTVTIASSSRAADNEFSLRILSAQIEFSEQSIPSHRCQKVVKLEQLKKQVESGDVEDVKQSLADPLLDLKKVQYGCLATAIKNGNREIFDLILQRKDLDLHSNQKERSLYLIALELPKGEGNYFALELAKKGFNPNPQWNEIQDLISKSSEMEPLKHHLDLLQYNKNGNNPLHQAILDRDVDLFLQFTQEEHLLNACNKAGKSPICLAANVWSENPDDGNGNLMVWVLLKKGANPNQVSRKGWCNLWDTLLIKKPLGWDKFMRKYYRGDARFSTYYLKIAPLVLDGLTDPTSIAIQNERIQRSALQTIMGIEFRDDLDGFSAIGSEGSIGSELFTTIHHGVEGFPGGDSSTKDDVEKLKKALQFAESIGKGRNYFDEQWQGITQEELWDQVEKLDINHNPLFIPIEWPNHAVGCVLYKETVILFNRGHEPIDGILGIHIFKRSKPLSKETFFTLISRVSKEKEKDFIQNVKDQLGLENKHVIKLKTQQHGNCGWSSSISLGIKGVLLALKLNKEYTNCDEVFARIKPVAKEVNHYIKFHTIDQYVQSIKTLLQTTAESYSEITLGEIVKKLIYKIETKPHSKWYKKALDSIIFSGAKMMLIRHNKRIGTRIVEKFSKRLAQIYNVSEESLHNAYRFI